MRVAVTGATGFIGGAIVRALSTDGHDVTGFGRAAVGPPGVRYVRWDLGIDGPFPGALRESDAVVHAAAHVAAWGDEGRFRAVTIDGTARLLSAIEPAARLVVIGSASVYVPTGSSQPRSESEEPAPASAYLGPYPRAKAEQERLVAVRRPDAIVLRPRIVWGPGDRTLLPRVEARIRRGVLVLPDGGRHRMSTTYVGSLVAAVRAALVRPEIRGPVNVADNTLRSPRELLTALFEARHRPVRIVSVPWQLADLVALGIEAVYRASRRQTEPPLTRYAIGAFGEPVILHLGRLHAELGIQPDVDIHRAATVVAGGPSPRD